MNQTDLEIEPPVPPPQPAKAVRKYYALPYSLLFVFLITFFAGPLFILALHVSGPYEKVATVMIPKGSSVQEIAQILDDNNILVNPLLFRVTARLMADDRLRAGEYRFEPGMNVLDVTAKLRDGKTIVRQITVPEGRTSYEIVNLLISNPYLSGTIEQIPPEGSLLPETYHFTHGDDRTGLTAWMQRDAQALLAKLWAERQDNLPLKTPQEAVILASIIEKETGPQAHERARVAGVFVNRLRLRMPLQSDPTVIYALTDGLQSLGRSLTRADLLTSSPMNTYVTPGLPPKPICNPGRAALEAALHPEKNEYLYFVADGTGGHAFAKTLSEHNNNVSQWLRLNRR
ncbi:MAG: endolytic transglycosylase MltG [Alphaproteobacteria bacterium]|nr:endolytic transglycosylase MltG [Alphaproteobacteria bacterium]